MQPNNNDNYDDDDDDVDQLPRCVRVVQRLAEGSHHSTSSADASDAEEFLGYLYFSAVAPLGAHGNPPSRVMFVEMHMKHTGQLRTSCCYIPIEYKY